MSSLTNLRELSSGLEAESEFLGNFGARVRELRALRGITRKTLSLEADVSERHLAQVEAGEGNVSVVLLRRIAAALNVSISDFFPSRNTKTGEPSLENLLRGLSPNRMAEIMAKLRRDLAAESKARKERIALIGLRGAGKSTLGKALAQFYDLPFVELDQEIEKDAAMPLAEIFSLYGQSGYRRVERQSLDRVVSQEKRAIISVGGGVVSESETYETLLANCFTVWISASPAEHMARVIAQGDFRAMAENNEAMEDLRRILQAREPLYRRADLHIDTHQRTVQESAKELCDTLRPNFAEES